MLSPVSWKIPLPRCFEQYNSRCCGRIQGLGRPGHGNIQGSLRRMPRFTAGAVCLIPND